MVEKNNRSESVRTFTLHSQILFEEQAGAFERPEEKVMHIILATNIAKSSITILQLYMVVDTAVRNVLRYSSGRGMSILWKERCSKASCTQRCGRVGREFPGVAIHLVTRQWYDQLPSYSESEMQTAPAEKLYLQARHIGPHFGVMSPFEFLSLAPHLPSEGQLQAALNSRAKLRAIYSKFG